MVRLKIFRPDHSNLPHSSMVHFSATAEFLTGWMWTQRPVASDRQTKLTDLDCYPSTSTIVITIYGRPM